MASVKGRLLYKCLHGKAITAELPMVRVVPAELYVWPTGPLLQPGLSHFQWALLVSQGLLQRLDQHLGLEDLLQGLDEQTTPTPHI